MVPPRSLIEEIERDDDNDTIDANRIEPNEMENEARISNFTDKPEHQAIYVSI